MSKVYKCTQCAAYITAWEIERHNRESHFVRWLEDAIAQGGLDEEALHEYQAALALARVAPNSAAARAYISGR